MRWWFVWLALLGPIDTFALESPVCEVSVDGDSYSLNKVTNPQRELKTLFAFLSKFKTSRNLVVSFSDRMKTFDLSVRPFYPRTDLPANTVAFFQLANTSVYLKSGELGTLAVLFFHEMVHALDPDFAARSLEWEKNPTPALRNQMVFAAERKAYDSQRALLEEIYQASPDCAERYFTFQEEQKNIVAHALTDEELANHYTPKSK